MSRAQFGEIYLFVPSRWLGYHFSEHLEVTAVANQITEDVQGLSAAPSKALGCRAQNLRFSCGISFSSLRLVAHAWSYFKTW